MHAVQSVQHMISSAQHTGDSLGIIVQPHNDEAIEDSTKHGLAKLLTKARPGAHKSWHFFRC